MLKPATLLLPLLLLLPNAGQAQDTTPPAVSGNPVVTPSAVDLSGGEQTVTISFVAEDPGSGVANILGYFQGPGFASQGAFNPSLVSGTVQNGTWEAETIIQATALDGSYDLVLLINDASNNASTLTFESLLSVSGGDSSPPELIGVPTIEPDSVVLSDQKVTVTAAVGVADAASGVKEVATFLTSSEGLGVAFGIGELVSGDESSGVWESEIEIDPLTINLLAPTGNLRLTLFVADNAGNSIQFPTESEVVIIREKPPVTFQVDLRRLERVGLFRRPFLFETGMRVFVDVLDGDEAGSYELSDFDFDSVWSVQVLISPRDDLKYSYVIDPDADGANLGDWVYERPGNPRSVNVSGGGEIGVDIFDDVSPEMVDANFAAQVLRAFPAGASDAVTFDEPGNETLVTLSIGSASVPSLVSIRRYTTDPGGSAPSGMSTISSGQQWIVDTVPASFSDETNARLAYDELGGISDPNALRLIRRDANNHPWAVVQTSVNTNESTLNVVTGGLVGEWTIASASAANSLVPVPPGEVSQPNPLDGDVAVSIEKVLTWQPAPNARTYDVYLWQDGRVEPEEPVSSDRTEAELIATELHLERSSTYQWYVVAKNLDGTSTSPVWSFSTELLTDLAISDVVVPDGGFSGREIELEWTVTNVSDLATDSPYWYDEVKGSADPSFFNGVDDLGLFENPSSLGPGEQYVQKATVRLPQDVVGTYYLRLEANGTRYQAEESYENNGFLSVIEVTLSPAVDLQVSEILAPANGFGGREIELSWTVENKGQGTAAAELFWVDEVWLSPSTEFDLESVEHLGSGRRSEPLAAGQSYTTTLPVVIPPRISGDQYLIVTTDAYGAVYEHSAEDNNTGVSDAIAVTLSPPPDLVPTILASPDAATSGETVKVEWRVDNQGPGAVESGNWTDRILLTLDGDPDQPIVLAKVTRAGSVAVDTSYAASATFALPDGIDGNHTFSVETDWTDAVFEHAFEDNNSTDFVISLTRPPYPDLAVVGLATASSSVAGTELDVRWTVENRGEAETDAAWTDRIYLSAAAEYDTTATPVGSLASTERLAPGKSYERATSVKLPVDLDGTQYLYVVADADMEIFEFPDEINKNVSSQAIEVSPYPPVDLAVVDATTESAAVSGQTISVSWTVTNVGDAAPPVSIWEDVVYLSADDRVDPDVDATLARIRRAEGLDPGASYDRRVDLRIPDAASGEFSILIHAETEDSDASNNVLSPDNQIVVTRGPSADLAMINSNAPSEAVAGQPFNMTWSARNTGDGSADGEWTDVVYLSADRSLGFGDLPIRVAKQNGPVIAGGQYQVEVELQIPFFSSGRQFLLVSLDDGDSVFEGSGESDNVATHEIDVTLAPPSDLIVTDVAVPKNVTPGDDVTISWTLKNQGQNSAQGVLRDAIYVSEDAEWQVTDPLMGSEIRVINLGPGESMAVSTKVNLAKSYQVDDDGNITDELPGVGPGAYRAIVRGDVQNNIRESDNDNNTTASADSMTSEIPLLAIDTSVDGTLVPQQSRYYRIEVPADVETLELDFASSTPNASNEMFVSQGRIPSRSDSDVKFQNPFGSSFVLQVPARSVGSAMTFYVLVYGREGPPEGLSYTLSAKDLEFELNEIDLAEGGQGGQVTVKMTGAAFGYRINAVLENENDQIKAIEVVRANSNEAYATFDLVSAMLGSYDFVLEKDQSFFIVAEDSSNLFKPDSNVVRSILPGAFRVAAPVIPGPVLDVKLPEAVLVDQDFTAVLEITNRGNTDLVSPLLIFWTNPATRSTIQIDDGVTEGHKRILLTGKAPVAGILRPGDTHRALITLAAPQTSGALRIFATLASEAGVAFNLDRELREAYLDSGEFGWGSAADQLRLDLESTGWRGYERMLARTASELSQAGVLEQDGSRLLLQLLRGTHEDLVSPAWGSGNLSSPGTAGKTTGDPCFELGKLVSEIPYTKDCSESQLVADRAVLTCVATAMATPQICGGVHGALHLAHFIAGDGSSIVYDNNSSVAAKLRGHDDANTSYQSIKESTQQALHELMTERMRDVGCKGLGGMETPEGDLGDLGISTPKPRTYADQGIDKGVPFYDPFEKGIPSLDEATLEQPGCDLVTSFGGFQSAEARISNFGMRSLSSPVTFECLEDCTIVWEADITYEFGDLYEFDEDDASGAFDARGRNLQLCGSAKPFRTKVIMQDKIGGIVRIPPKKKNCKKPEPPELPPFVFEPVPWTVPVITSRDPNDIVGPAGFGDDRWVSVSATLPYKIRFENDPDQATAPAHVVSIEQQLPDATVDIRSFRLGRFGFGGFKFDPPDNTASYVDRLDLTDSLGIYVDVNAGLDVEGNRVFWVMRTVDAATGRAPSDPFAGFLPVNDSLGSGEGFVSYTVRPNPQSKTGDIILAKADIVFDNNGVIATPEIFNTIDAVLPTSRIVEVPFRADSTIFPINWLGRDDDNGSGVSTFAVYASKDGGPFELYRKDLEGTSVLFNAEQDHRYHFFTLSSDLAGNQEPTKTRGDVQVVVGIEEERELPDEFSLGQNYPNPFNPSTTIPYALTTTADVELVVYTMLGQRVIRYKMDAQRAGLHTQQINMRRLASGIYFYQLEARDGPRVLFSDVKKMVFVK